MGLRVHDLEQLTHATSLHEPLAVADAWRCSPYKQRVALSPYLHSGMRSGESNSLSHLERQRR